jgi:hypothetical protein
MAKAAKQSTRKAATRKPVEVDDLTAASIATKDAHVGAIPNALPVMTQRKKRGRRSKLTPDLVARIKAYQHEHPELEGHVQELRTRLREDLPIGDNISDSDLNRVIYQQSA